MTHCLYVASSNQGKLRDFRAAATACSLLIKPLPKLMVIPAPEENGLSFAANAALKAVYYSRFAAGEMVVADDSGLEVDALGGAPGVHSARFSGEHSTDQANNLLLLEKLRGVANRSARFVCVIALVEGERLRGVFRGAVAGVILDEPRGSSGFGYDPLFYSPALGLTFGEAPAERKFSLSHRGQALRAMLAAL